ncbi:hypothetical protein KUTeg_007756 [Tegillarca granosa]|uniref:Vesicle transport protein n=1 Tax=Tegillarca granosa TaxID=220873 RepID=A0ABQ9FE69_TEGGR|nr:hypothetical protein KUTeg_007756 [Tegillarca granosa]
MSITSALKYKMDKLKKALSGDDEEEETGIVTQISDASTLSWSTRIKGFIICFALGVVMSVLGSCLLFLKNGLVIFAVLYSFGNILALASTCFLMGPVNQLKKMFAKTRVIATILVFVMLILTLVCAFAVDDPKPNSCNNRDAVKKCFSACLDV